MLPEEQATLGANRAPSPAERARSIVARPGATALIAGAGHRIAPHMQHVHADGTVSVLLGDQQTCVGAAWSSPRRELACVLEVVDRAPIPLREPVRGLVWLTGWARLLTGQHATDEALRVAGQRSDPKLLDLGHGYVMMRLTPTSVVLADADGSEAIGVATFTQAEADPFCCLEPGWLRHLVNSHPDVLDKLRLRLPATLRRNPIRPLGVDRWGLRLRVEGSSSDHDVRLSFSRPVSTTRELAIQIRQLVGCPFLAAQPEAPPRYRPAPGTG